MKYMYESPYYRFDRRLTPGITRRPKPLQVYDKRRGGDRVHAVVGPLLACSRLDPVIIGDTDLIP